MQNNQQIDRYDLEAQDVGGSFPPTPLAVAGNQYYSPVVYGKAHLGNSIFNGGSHIHNYPPRDEGTVAHRKPMNTIKWRRDPDFVGREDVLQRMIHDLEEKEGFVALTGAGGVGKSQIAVEYCWRLRERKPHFHIFWIYVDTIEAFNEGYRELARRLRLISPTADVGVTNVRNIVKDWLEDNDNWLMVIDNADFYDDFFGTEDQTSDAVIGAALPLCRPTSAMIIYTSRHTRVGARLTTESSCLRVTPLPAKESRMLLCRKLKGVTIEYADASKLLKAVEFLPLSIAHAAAYLNFTKIPIKNYLATLEDSDEGLLDMFKQEMDIGRRDRKAPRSVIKALLATHELLFRHNQVAANLCFFMACLDRQNIAEELIFLATDPVMEDARKAATSLKLQGPPLTFPKSQGDIWTALGELESLALVEASDEGRVYTMHRFVQVLTVRHMSVSGNLRAFSVFSAHCLLKVFSIGVDKIFSRQDGRTTNVLSYTLNLVSNVVRVSTLLRRWNQEDLVFELLSRCAIHYYDTGTVPKAVMASKLAGCEIPYVIKFYESMKALTSRQQASGLLRDYIATVAEAITHCRSTHDKVYLHIASNLSLARICLAHENVHSTFVRLLCADLRQQRRRESRNSCEPSKKKIRAAMQDFWHTLQLMQTRQLLIAVWNHFATTAKLVIHEALCDECDESQFISGVRHKCLHCEEYDLCSACLDSYSDRVSCKRHVFVPVYDDDTFYRKASCWTAMPTVFKAPPAAYSFVADRGRICVASLREYWHADIADARGWESEPDESRRTKTRFAKHYSCGKSHRHGPGLLRSRSKSLEPGRPRFVKAHDHVRGMMHNMELWHDVNKEALEES